MLDPSDIPPIPSHPDEAARWEHTRLRRRLLYGLWRDDLERRMRTMMGHVRQSAIGEPDMSANPFAASCAAVAALYDRAPLIRHSDTGAAETMTALVERAGLWALMQRAQRDVLGLRELLIRVDASETSTGVEVVYRPVYPDLVLADPDPERPDRPRVIREATRLADSSGRARWVWDTWSLDDGGSHRILAADQARTDVSNLYGLESPEPLRDETDRPVLPYVLYHAARGGSLWDPYHGREVVEGTLNVGVYWTFTGHCLRNASWPQRWMLGVEVAGAQLEDGSSQEPRREVVADPAVVLELQPTADYQGQPQAGQWQTASDPLHFAEAVVLYERRLIAYAGLDPSDVQRVSGDPRSGYSLAITREGKREAQRRLAPVFALPDAELLRVTAIAVNRALGITLLPETGWSVEYQSLPPSAEERAAEREEAVALLAAGLISRPEARARILGEDLERARVAIAAIDGDDAGADDTSDDAEGTTT